MLFKKENYQIKSNSIGFYQDLDHLDGIGLSAVSANLYEDKKRDELVIFYFRKGASYASVYTQSNIRSENIKWNLNNSKDKVRIAQYISMMPAQEDDNALVKWRVSSWKNRIAPEGYAFPGDPRNWEQTKYETAKLSLLGRKLLGLDKW